jgi:hypothetical protein
VPRCELLERGGTEGWGEVKISVLETLTRQDQLETPYGTPRLIDSGSLSSALLVALGLRMVEGATHPFAKELHIDLKAVCRQVKPTATTDTTAAKV